MEHSIKCISSNDHYRKTFFGEGADIFTGKR